MAEDLLAKLTDKRRLTELLAALPGAALPGSALPATSARREPAEPSSQPPHDSPLVPPPPAIEPISTDPQHAAMPVEATADWRGGLVLRLHNLAAGAGIELCPPDEQVLGRLLTLVPQVGQAEDSLEAFFQALQGLFSQAASAGVSRVVLGFTEEGVLELNRAD